MDAITLLTNDHRTVENLFSEYQTAVTPEMKKQCVDRMIMELSVHAGIEEVKFYPTVKERAAGMEDLVEESLDEHQQVKDTLAELERLSPDSPEYDSKVQALMSEVKHHVEEEEGQLFPQVRSNFSADQLSQLGTELEEAKKTAPTHPHPMAPSGGPAAKIAGMAAGAMDRARDTMHPNQEIREEVRGEEAERTRGDR